MNVVPKDQTIILGDIQIGQKLYVLKNGYVTVYATYNDLTNNINQINVPIDSVMIYNGSYSEPAVYNFTYNKQPVLISQSSLYNILKGQMLR